MTLFEDHKHWPIVKELCQTLQKSGFKAYLAGGCVRDSLLGRQPSDFDVATDATPQQVQSLFEKTLDLGIQFAVIVVVINDIQIEVSTFRGEGAYTDGRRPEKIYFTNPEQDALRRDFTVNSLFYDMATNQVLDFCGGLVDLKKRELKCVGVAENRFNEDRLRVLRLFRFASQLGFNIEESTLIAAYKYVESLEGVSRERIGGEFRKLVFGSHSLRGLYWLKTTDLLPLFFGETLGKELLHWAILEEWQLLAKESGSDDESYCDKVFILLAIYYLEKKNWIQIEQAFKSLCISKKVIRGIQARLEGLNLLQSSKNLGEIIEFLLRGNSLIVLEFYSSVKFQNIFGGNKVCEKAIALTAHWIKAGAPKALISGSDLLKLKNLPKNKYSKIIKIAYWHQLCGDISTKSEALNWLNEKNFS